MISGIFPCTTSMYLYVWTSCHCFSNHRSSWRRSIADLVRKSTPKVKDCKSSREAGLSSCWKKNFFFNLFCQVELELVIKFMFSPKILDIRWNFWPKNNVSCTRNEAPKDSVQQAKSWAPKITMGEYLANPEWARELFSIRMGCKYSKHGRTSFNIPCVRL